MYTINTLEAAWKLKGARMDTEQAEAVARGSSRGSSVAHQGEQLATKSDIAGLRWMIGLHFAFTLVILGFVYQSNQQVNQLTQQVAHLSGVVERLPGTDRN